MDLSGMKKILWVNRENRVAMVEPGVTFNELIPAVAEKGLRLNMPLKPRQSKSVIGSMLEREPVILPKYHWMWLTLWRLPRSFSVPETCSGLGLPLVRGQ